MRSIRQQFFQHLAQTSPSPLALHIERAEGVWLYGPEGQRWLDLISGIGPSVLGHNHPEIKAAVQAQLDRYWHTMVYGEYILSPQVELAALLAELTPGLDAVYYVNSGAEATEGAMKLAKRYTGRSGFVACKYAYHGSTHGPASLMNPTDFTLPYYPMLPGVRHILFDCDACLSRIDDSVAAVVIETIQGEAGLRTPRTEWLRALRQRCDEVGALLVFDEIQAAYGRTGYLFAFERFGVTPDILLLGKGFGGGMPAAAFLARREVMACLSERPVLGHITTFGGHPVCMAAALRTLQLLRDMPLLQIVSEKEALFRALLQHPAIRELRSAGLWLAIDLDDAARVQRCIAHCIAQGVVTDWFLFNDRSIRIAPPLIISEVEIRFACEVILAGLDA